jgi:hypothetical protein
MGQGDVAQEQRGDNDPVIMPMILYHSTKVSASAHIA